MATSVSDVGVPCLPVHAEIVKFLMEHGRRVKRWAVRSVLDMCLLGARQCV